MVISKLSNFSDGRCILFDFVNIILFLHNHKVYISEIINKVSMNVNYNHYLGCENIIHLQ